MQTCLVLLVTSITGYSCGYLKQKEVVRELSQIGCRTYYSTQRAAGLGYTSENRWAYFLDLVYFMDEYVDPDLFYTVDKIYFGAGLDRRHLNLLKELPSLREIHFGLKQELGDVFEMFPKLDNVVLLSLSSTNAETKHVKSLLRKMRNIQSLYLHGTDIIDGDLANVSKLSSITYLDLSSTNIGNEGLRTLAKLNSLSGIDLSKTNVTLIGLENLGRHCPLESLTVNKGLEEEIENSKVFKLLPGCDIRYVSIR